jgi:hypothetical protein
LPPIGFLGEELSGSLQAVKQADASALSAVVTRHHPSLPEIVGPSSRSARFQGFLLCRARVPHVENNLPASILLFLPDAGVFAMLNNRLAIFAQRSELVVAVGIAQIA